MSLVYSSPDVEAYTYKDLDIKRPFPRQYFVQILFYYLYNQELCEAGLIIVKLTLLWLVRCAQNYFITIAESGHKMAKGSLTRGEVGRLLACGEEHSGHGMLGTVTLESQSTVSTSSNSQDPSDIALPGLQPLPLTNSVSAHTHTMHSSKPTLGLDLTNITGGVISPYVQRVKQIKSDSSDKNEHNTLVSYIVQLYRFAA